MIKPVNAHVAARFKLAVILLVVVLLLSAPAYRAWQQQKLDNRLITAIYRNDAREVVSLLRAGANPNATELRPGTARSPWRRIVEAFRNWRSPRSGDRLTALEVLTGSRISNRGIVDAPENTLIATALLDAGASPNVNHNGLSPLYQCLTSQHYATAEILLTRGANPNLGLADGITVAGLLDGKMLSLMIKHGLDLRGHDVGGTTPLMISCETGLGRADMLIAAGEDPNALSVSRDCALTLAICWRRPADIHLLLTHGADPNILAFDTPLHLATAGGDLQTVRELIADGADVNLRGANNESPLAAAEAQPDTRLRSVLVAHGAVR